MLKVKKKQNKTKKNKNIGTKIDAINLALVSSVLTLNRFTHCFGVSIVNFEQLNAVWDMRTCLHSTIATKTVNCKQSLQKTSYH